MGEVLNFHAERKKINEAHETMHYVAPENSERNKVCSSCRMCSICGEPACNDPGSSSYGNRWTDDLETWAKHTHPCKSVPILGQPK